MIDQEPPLFSLNHPIDLTQNMQGLDSDIDMNGIDSIQVSGGGGGGGDEDDFFDKVFWSVEDVEGVNTPVRYIFRVKEVS